MEPFGALGVKPKIENVGDFFAGVEEDDTLDFGVG